MFGRSLGQWLTIVLVVFVALVLFQLIMDGLRAVGGGLGRSVANRAERLAGVG